MPESESAPRGTDTVELKGQFSYVQAKLARCDKQFPLRDAPGKMFSLSATSRISCWNT
jgi:hypothetical protein